MKQNLFALCTLGALVALPAGAAKRIQMETTDLATSQVTTREILIDRTRVRVDDGTRRTMFLTAGGNRMVMVDRTRNEYREMTQQDVEAMGTRMQGATSQMDAAMQGMSPEQRAMMEKMMQGRMPGGAAAAPKIAPIVFTARGSGSAAGYACTKYEGARDGTKVAELCAAEAAALKLAAADFEVYEKMREFTEAMQKSMRSSPMGAMMQPQSGGGSGVRGYPVEETNFRNGKPVSRTVLKSIADVPATDADFSTGGAKKAGMGMRGERGRPE